MLAVGACISVPDQSNYITAALASGIWYGRDCAFCDFGAVSVPFLTRSWVPVNESNDESFICQLSLPLFHSVLLGLGPFIPSWAVSYRIACGTYFAHIINCTQPQLFPK